MTKALIFDASSLISMALNGLFAEIRGLKKAFGGKFIVTKEVYSEMVERPIKINRFKLEAIRLKQLVDEGVLEFPVAIGVKDAQISLAAHDILDIANASFVGDRKEIHLIDLGEASCLALSRILDEKKQPNLLVIDERTTRIMCEKPANLVKLLRRKLHTRVRPNKKNFDKFGGCRIIRSAELVYIAYKKGLVNLKDPQTLSALLWAVKFKGCSISGEEIKEIENLK